MLPANVNIVLTGENLPVQAIAVSDFKFNGRPLRETVRFPMGLNAETQGASLQILPDRIQILVTEVTNIAADATHLQEMIAPIFDYIGPKSFKGVGHNAQFVLDPLIPKSAVAKSILNVSEIANILSGDVEESNISVFRHIPNGAMLRTTFSTQTPVDRIVMEFNAHFDVSGSSARDAISCLKESLDTMAAIVDRAQGSLLAEKLGSK
ncbi:hypothetical protein [Mycobacterium scrofulaceum]|uniref:hypothetical protein n=1 Tax=Mycobacterium scrofulaceum TaxID=1783 RepID=UPI0012E9A66D|nr:hypothetical protein [Mycobacterium scrofulaceum]